MSDPSRFGPLVRTLACVLAASCSSGERHTDAGLDSLDAVSHPDVPSTSDAPAAFDAGHDGASPDAISAACLPAGDTAPCTDPPAQTAFDATGLTAVRYAGVQYFHDGACQVTRVTLEDAAGTRRDADLGAGVLAVDAASGTMTRTFAWGSVACTFAPGCHRLDVTVAVHNASSTDTLRAVEVQPFTLQLPGAPTEYDGSTPLLGTNLASPTRIALHAPSATVVLVDTDVARPLVLGFPYATDRPTDTVFPIRLNTDHDPIDPDSLPTVDRPVAPGGSDRYALSLRFGAAGASLSSLSADVSAAYARAFPPTLRWNDHRAIGALFLSSAAIGSATNPRGWFNDPSVDVTTDAGRAALRTRVLAWADNDVAILHAMNAQGAVTWDIEGQQFPHATSYVCDPRQLATVAPEMEPIADAYFHRFIDAGLRVGVCVRPTQFVLAPGGGAAEQDPVSDPTSLMIDKIRYAHDRWGATLFYVDSNVDAHGAAMDPAVFERIAAMFPDSLLMPEHEDVRYWASTAPYDQLTQGVDQTAADVLDVYPCAFSVIYTADGAIDAHHDALLAGARRGDVLMFRAWYDEEPANMLVRAIEQAAGH